jgi:hypothetical protein
MTLGNMRHLGVKRLIAHCLNPACRHEVVTRPKCACSRHLVNCGDAKRQSKHF